jgi:hypothetical protein
MAWTRKVLRVNLINGTCESVALNMEWAKKYLGSRGLATKYYIEECWLWWGVSARRWLSLILLPFGVWVLTLFGV